MAILGGPGPVQGVVRFLQLTPERCLIEGTIDGLQPGLHGLHVHQFGDWTLHLPCPLPGQPFFHPYLTLSLSSPRHLQSAAPQELCPDPGPALHTHCPVTLLPFPMHFCSLPYTCIALSAHGSGQLHL